MTKAIIPICEHIKDDGARCGSPALRGQTLCYYHDRDYRRHRIPPHAGCHLVPRLNTDRQIRAATRNAIRACSNGQLDKGDLKAFLYGFQVARSLLPKPQRRRKKGPPPVQN